MSKNILIVDHVHESLLAHLTERDFVCEVNKNINYQDFIDLPDDYVGLIIRSRFQVDKEIINSKKSLRFIVRIGSGMENIDIDYAGEHGINCIHTPEGNANAVAEHCLGLLLGAVRNIPVSNQEVRKGQWLREKNKGFELGSRTCGIIGYGNTGRAFAQVLHQFGCKIYVYDKFNVGFNDDFIEEVSLDLLLEKCDVISLHINYIPENKYFINDKLIQKILHPFILINSSRGKTVKTKDIIPYLKSGHIQYACLDVLEFENVRLQNSAMEEWEPEMKELASLENVILTPHLGGQTFDAEKRHAQVAFQKICNLLEI